MERKTKSQKGFTIIEVILVLAMAGLIFMMVFIALPNLQRSQRDATRKDDMMLFVENLKKYQGNNRGALPEGGVSHLERPTSEPSNETSWASFYYKYLDEDFKDPRDDVYYLTVTECVKNGDRCGYADPGYDNTIYVFTQGTCSEDHAIPSSNPRNFAVIYRTESSGIYCFNS